MKKTKHARKAKSFFDKLMHLLEKRGQGLPMTTIVIIVIVLIVLSVVVFFFFGQFTSGQKTVEQQQQLGTSATDLAQCNAWANKLISSISDTSVCPQDVLCTAYCNGVYGVKPVTCTKC